MRASSQIRFACHAMVVAAGLLWAAAPAGVQQPLKVGFFGPLTDRFAALGIDAKKGADLAIKLANDAGGVNGRKIELVAYDDRGNRTESIAVVRKMIEQDNVVAIVGGSLTLTSIASAPVANQEKGPMVAASSNAAGVGKGNAYLFRWASFPDFPAC